MELQSRLTRPRGAALVLALLVMLVLSGLALVAMESTTTSSRLAGTHRMAVQTESISNAINELGVLRSGRQAGQYYAQIQDEFNADDAGEARRGGFLIFSSNAESDEIQLQGDGSSLDTGTFLDGTYQAVESDPALQTEYRYIVRDATVGPRAQGFGDEFCFIRVTVGSDADVESTGYDPTAPAEERLRQGRALGRNLSQAMIGPIECS